MHQNARLARPCLKVVEDQKQATRPEGGGRHNKRRYIYRMGRCAALKNNSHEDCRDVLKTSTASEVKQAGSKTVSVLSRTL